ncbi:MAG: hypothetical protein IKZ82_00265, partial [Clostridia bacterium]|nr:hypothetical protein [Clostridia bacterium]
VFYTSNSIPQTLVVDKTGKVLMHKIGAFMSYDQMLESIKPYMDGTAAESSAPIGAGSETIGAKPKAASCLGF